MRLHRKFAACAVLCAFVFAALTPARAAAADVATGDFEIGYLYADILPRRAQALQTIAGIVGADASAHSALSRMGSYSASHFSGGGLPVRSLNDYGRLATAAVTGIVPALLSSHGGSDAAFPEDVVEALKAAFVSYDETVRVEASLIIPAFAARAPGQLELADLYYHGEAAYDFCHDFRIVAMMRNIPLDEDQKKPLPSIPSLPPGIAAMRGVSNPFSSTSDYSFAMIFDDIRASQRQAMREFAKALDYQDAVAQNIEMQSMATDSFGLLETEGDEADSMVIGDTFNNIALLEFAMEKESLSEESKKTFHGALVMYKAAVGREAGEVSKGAIVSQRTLEYGGDALNAFSGFRSGGVGGIFQGVASLGRIGGRAAADVENAKAGRRLTRMSQRNQLFYTLWEKTAVRLGVDLPDGSEPVPATEPATYAVTDEGTEDAEAEAGESYADAYAEAYGTESASDASAPQPEVIIPEGVVVESAPEPYYVEPQPVETPIRAVRRLFGRF